MKKPLFEFIVPSYFEIGNSFCLYEILVLQDKNGKLITIRIEKHVK